MKRLLAALFVLVCAVVGANASESAPAGVLLLQGNKNTTALLLLAAAVVVVLYIMRRRRRIQTGRSA